MTNNERERLAYAEGYTETAAILARLDDAHAALGSEASLQAQLDDALDDVHRLQDELELELALCSDLRRQADQWHEEYKVLRSALMALEAEVPLHTRQFIREVLK